MTDFLETLPEQIKAALEENDRQKRITAFYSLVSDVKERFWNLAQSLDDCFAILGEGLMDNLTPLWEEGEPLDEELKGRVLSILRQHPDGISANDILRQLLKQPVTQAV